MERTKGSAPAMRGLQLLEDITKAINGSSDLPSAFRVALRKVCEATGWAYGEVWMPSPDHTVLECCYAWHRKSKSLEAFQEATQRFTFQPGVGLPGHVWVSKQPEWLPAISVTLAERFPRGQSALKAGLKAVFGVPLVSDGEVLGIFVFFLSASRKEDKEAVAMVSAVANHLGSFIQRKRAEEALRRAYDELEEKVRWRTEELEHANAALQQTLEAAREGEATIRALLESAAQGILAINEEGQIVLANAMTEKFFGYTYEEILGKPVEVLLPEGLRQRHTQHRTDYFSRPHVRPMGGSPDLVGRRKDGTEFPIEVSLSYIQTKNGLLGVGFVMDITDRKRAEEKLRALTGQLISAREEEAKRLARELHDAFGQRLAVLNMKVSELGGILPSQPALAAEKLRQVGQEIGNVAKDVHQLSRRLHPAVLSQLGLEIALESECAAYSQQHGIRVEFSSTNVPELLSDDIALCFFRVAQECLQNIRKHAHAKRACVSLIQRDHEIVLTVQDFGKGFDLDGIRGRAGLGLVSMEERVRLANGNMSVRSQPGQGTQIEVRIPVGRS